MLKPAVVREVMAEFEAKSKFMATHSIKLRKIKVSKPSYYF